MYNLVKHQHNKTQYSIHTHTTQQVKVCSFFLELSQPTPTAPPPSRTREEPPQAASTNTASFPQPHRKSTTTVAHSGQEPLMRQLIRRAMLTKVMFHIQRSKEDGVGGVLFLTVVNNRGYTTMNLWHQVNSTFPLQTHHLICCSLKLPLRSP